MIRTTSPFPLAAFVLTALFFLWESQLSAQERLHYDAFRNQEKVGYLTVLRDCENGVCHYDVENALTISLLIDVNLLLRFQCDYRGDRLISAFTQQMRNQKLHEFTRLRLLEAGYQHEKNRKLRQLSFQDIRYSTMLMYFQEPLRQQEVFSERFGTFVPVSRVAPATYNLHLPNGTTVAYTYENGLCNKLVIEHMLGNIDFVLRPELTSVY